MSQDTSSQPDTRPNESDNVSEPPQKKRRCITVVCSICLEDIPEMNILAHVQLCAYNHEKKHGLPHQCCPCGHKSTKNRTLSVSIDVTSDDEEQQLQSPLNKGPSYHEEPLRRARKNGKVPQKCILGDKTLCPAGDNAKVRGKLFAKGEALCTKLYNAKDNVILMIGENSYKICRYTHFSDTSMINAMAPFFKNLPAPTIKPTSLDELCKNYANELESCKRFATKHLRIKGRDTAAKGAWCFCSAKCLINYMRALKTEQWKTFIDTAIPADIEDDVLSL
jgi:hypothetical protein